MTRETKRKVSTAIRYTLLILVGFIMVYPLIWMVGATFKTNSEIFTSAWFLPKNPVFDGYSNAFKSYGGKISLITSLINTYKIVIPKVIFTVVSATICAADVHPVSSPGGSQCAPVHYVQQVEMGEHLPSSDRTFLVCSRYLLCIHADPVPQGSAQGAGGSCQD